MTQDLYALLGVEPTAEPEAINEAFFRLAEESHLAANTGQATLVDIQDLSEAWQVLSDPQQRARYDALLRAERRALRRQQLADESQNPFRRVAALFWSCIGLLVFGIHAARKVIAVTVVLAAVIVCVAIFINLPASPTPPPPPNAGSALAASVDHPEPARAAAQPAVQPTAVPPTELPSLAIEPAALAAEPTVAALLPTTAPLPTEAPSSTAVAAVFATAPAWKAAPGDAPAVSLPRLPTMAPTVTPSGPVGFKYPAPLLVSPGYNSVYDCDRPLTLSWTLDGGTPALGENEWFLLESKPHDGDAWQGMTDWTGDYSVTLNLRKAAKDCSASWLSNSGTYDWRVIVVLGDRSTHSLEGLLSPAAASFTLLYHS